MGGGRDKYFYIQGGIFLHTNGGGQTFSVGVVLAIMMLMVNKRKIRAKRGSSPQELEF